ncbi:MAG: nickel-dependent lactate racemase [Candidatus Lokiarchaeota archaeon]|nr:nickel-dependent lactate racemase [Candidatus Lokiarchaeota archaeon]
MEFALPYGKSKISFRLPEGVGVTELKLPEQKVIENPEDLLFSTFKNPIFSKPLHKLLEASKPQTITIVVDDQTRKFPHDKILIPLLRYMENYGISKESITILIATGVHREPTFEELISLFGQYVVDFYTIKWNDQRNSEYIYFGETSRGTPIQINSVYANADFKIVVSDVTLHYFAGFGGDRKSVFPGVASAKSINKNHALVMQGIYPGNIESNPIHKDMQEAAEAAGADFVINVNLDSYGNILDIKSGALNDAFMQAVEKYKPTCTISINKAADVLILSAGGYPFDSNYQQSMKAIMQCQTAVKPKGIVLYFIKCEKGLGIPAFQQYLEQFPDSQSILKYLQTHEYEQGMHNVYLYRKFIEEHDVYYITDLPCEYVEECLQVKYVDNVQTLIDQLVTHDKSIYIIPHGTKVMIEGSSNA